MRNNLFVIEGMDGSGKQTQAAATYNALKIVYPYTITASFPSYDNESSVLVKSYLKGNYTHAAEHVDQLTFVKQMSTFYSVDRVASFMSPLDGPSAPHPQRTLMSECNRGCPIILDRYTTSNLLHQTSNINDVNRQVEYVKWMQELEYEHLGLPVPRQVFYLDIPYTVALANIEKRYEGKPLQDIHEGIEHLRRVYETKELVVDMCGWTKINCVDHTNTMRHIEDINAEITASIIYKLNANDTI